MTIIKWRVRACETNSSSSHSLTICSNGKNQFVDLIHNGILFLNKDIDHKISDIVSILPESLLNNVLEKLGKQMGFSAVVFPEEPLPVYSGTHKELQNRYGYNQNQNEVDFWVDVLSNDSIALFVQSDKDIGNILARVSPYDIKWFWESQLESLNLMGWDKLILVLNGKPDFEQLQVDDWVYFIKQFYIFHLYGENSFFEDIYNNYPVAGLRFSEFMDILKEVNATDGNPIIIKDLYIFD